jgi:sorting nexin-25
MEKVDMPGKLLASIMKKRSTFLELRRIELEKYINTLLLNSEVCNFEIFRRFICHPEIIKLMYANQKESPVKRSFISNVFVSVDDSVNSLRLKKSKSTVTINHNQKEAVFLHNPISELKQEQSFEQTSLTEPLIDLFIELFELKGLRRQAVVIFLNQLFGDTVERKVTESLHEIVSEQQILNVITKVRDTYWPGGVWGMNYVPRTEEQKIRSRFDASGKITLVFPDLFGGVVGRQNARRGAIRSCLLFQNRRLNQHLLYKILDEVLAALFPK